MKPSKVMLVLLTIVGLLVGLTPEARGGADPPIPVCQVAKAGGPLMKGTGALTVTFTSGTIADVSATLRLQFQGNEAFFRARLSGVDVISAEWVACEVVTALQTQILSDFGIDPSKQLKFTSRSISGLGFGPIPSTSDFSAIGDITLHVQ